MKQIPLPIGTAAARTFDNFAPGANGATRRIRNPRSAGVFQFIPLQSSSRMATIAISVPPRTG